MAEYTQFLTQLTLHIGNMCPRVILLSAIKSAVRQFCEDSEVWVYDCPESEIISSKTSQIRLDIPNHSFICKLWTIAGRQAMHDPHRQYIEVPRYHLNGENYLVFEEEFKRVPQKLNPIISLSTTQDSLSCPDFIYQRYHDAIISKAVVILQSMPAQSWSDPSMLGLHQPLYEQYLTKAIKDRDDGFMLGRQVARIKPSFM